MKHKWIVSQLGTQSNHRGSVSFASDRGNTFKRYMAMQKLKKAALSEMAGNLTTEEVGILGETFKKIDKDGETSLHGMICK